MSVLVVTDLGVLPSGAVAALGVRPLLTNEEFVDVLHVHADAYGSDARHACQVQLLRPLEVHWCLVAVLLASDCGRGALARGLLLAARAELPHDLPATPWALMTLGHFLLHEAGDFGRSALRARARGARLIAAPFVVELTVAADVTAGTGWHGIGFVLRLGASLACMEVAIVVQDAVLGVVPATLPLVAERPRTRLLVR